MNRTQKKCLLVSAVLHLGLLSSVVLFSAFRPAPPPALEFQPIDFTPVITTFDNMSGGGNPNGQALPPPPQRPPVPPAQRPPEPPPRQAAPQAPPRFEEESFTPSTRTAHKRPQIDTSNVVIRPRHEKSKARPRDNDEDTDTQDRELARAAAEARQHLLSGLRQMAGQIGDSRSGPVSVELKGPGGGGLPYANFYQAVYSIYEQEWIIPDGATETEVTTVAEVTVARDGRVVSAEIVRKSGNAAVDQSVRLTLDRVRRLPALPPGAEKDTETITINFKARPQRGRSS